MGPSPLLELEAFVATTLVRLLNRPLATVAAEVMPARPASPKGAAREAARTLAQRGGSSKAHEALRLQLEQHKRERSAQSKTAREAKAAYQRRLKAKKAKERHREH